MIANLELRFLGGLHILIDGVPLTHTMSSKGKALLCYLSVTGKEHSRSSLAGLLWTDIPETNARANLRKTLSRIKPHLGSHLTITRENIAFNPDAPHWLDVTDFEGGLKPGSDFIRLQKAVSLYQGDFLECFYLPDAPLFDEWVLSQRAWLRGAALNCFQSLVSHFIHEGAYERAISYARRLLDIEPWHEEAYRELMGLLALSGQRSAALMQYETCRRILVEDLGVEPDPATVTLYDQIRQGKFDETKHPDQGAAVGSVVDAQITPQHTSLHHNLPAQTTPFIGRETELVELESLLTDPTIRLVTICGAGGMGKTRLAIEAALAQLEYFNQGVYFVPLESLEDPDQIVGTIAEIIDYSFHEGDNPQQQLLDYLRPKTLLLVMDNFEHLVAQARLAAILLQEAPGLKILVTSRARLNVQGEQLFQIEGIEFPQPTDSSEQASQSGAVKLFVQSARRVQPGFKLSTDSLQEIVQICHLVEGMPLAIILAAAWIEILSPAKIKSEIYRAPDILEIQIQDAPRRHWSIRSVFDHSWRLMAEREKQIFQTLSVFRGGFTPQSGLEVTKTSIQVLRSFVNKSLLGRTSTGRFHIHELLRQYAEGKLHQKTADYEAARNAHCAYYCTFLYKWESELKTSGRLNALVEINKERENVRSSWNWAVAHGQTERLERALESLAAYYQWRGYYREGEGTLRAATEKLSTLDTDEHQQLQIRLFIWQANFNRDLGQTEQAAQQVRRSLDMLDAPELSNQDLRLERADALYCLGSVTLRHDYEGARRVWQKSYELYQAVGEQWGMAKVLGSLAMIAWELGQYDEAKQLIEENLAIEKALGNQIGIGNMFSTLGWIALTQGRLYQAEELAQKCLNVYRETGDQAHIAKGLRDLGAPKMFLGRFSEADALLEESAAMYNELGGSGDQVFTNILLGAAKAHLGQYGSARSQEEIGLKFAQKFDDRAGMGRALLWLGRISLVEGAYSEAHHLLQESTAIFLEVGQKDQLSTALASLAHSTYTMGNLDEARQCLVKALKTAASIGAFLPLLFVIPLTAQFAVDRGENKQAVELYTLASRYSFVTNSCWFENVFGRHIPNATGSLQADVVTVDQERGIMLDLWATAKEILEELD